MQNFTRLIASILLATFFLNTSQPVRLAKAETSSEDVKSKNFKFKAPQTVNIQSNEVNSFEGYDNSIKKVIPEQKIESNEQEAEDKLLRSVEQTIKPGVPATIDTTPPVAISKLMQSYQ